MRSPRPRLRTGRRRWAFALALAARFLDRRPASALLIGESFASLEAGALYGPGLVAHGLPLHRLVFVSAPDAPLGLLGDGGGAEMRRARRGGGRDLELEALRPPGLPPPPDGRAKRRDAGARSCWRAPTARRTRCPPPPRPASRSPPRRARKARRRPAGICPGPFACMARLVKARAICRRDR